MEEKIVKVLASLLNTEEETVKAASEKEDGLDTLVSEFRGKNQVYNLQDLAKLKDNIRKQTIESLTEDDIPMEFKNKAVGWKLEALEKDIKETYGYEGDYKNLKGLVDNIVKQAKNNKDGDANSEEIQALKDQIVKISKEKDDAVKVAKSNFDNQLINIDFNRAINNIGLNYEDGDALEIQKDLLQKSFLGTIKLQRKGDATIMIGEDGKPIVDAKLDPVPLDEGVANFAKKYGFQLKEEDHGGRGGSSSKQKNVIDADMSYEDYRKSKGVSRMTAEDDALYKEWTEARQQQ